jgi:hypothetical protein
MSGGCKPRWFKLGNVSFLRYTSAVIVDVIVDVVVIGP